jgi:hypothetical protein
LGESRTAIFGGCDRDRDRDSLWHHEPILSFIMGIKYLFATAATARTK